MTPTTPQLNVAARMGRWSSQHRRKAILGWLAFVVIALAAGNLAGMRMLTGADSMTGESRSAQQTLDAAGRDTDAGESVLVQSRSDTVGSARFRAVLRATRDAVGAQRWVLRIRSPLEPGNDMLVSPDRHSALIQFDVPGDVMQNMERVKP